MSERLGTQLQSGGLEQSIHTGLLGKGMFAGASLDLNFAATKNIGPLVTFTRASTATFINSAGVLQTAATNEPRFNHSITSSTTNLLLRSEEFDNASWINQNSTEAVDASIATPTGGSNAYRLTDTGANGTHNIYQTTAIGAGVAVTFSIYARESSIRYIRVNNAVSTTDYAVADFDLQAAVVTQTGNGATGTVSNVAVQSVGNGWVRCSATFTTAGANRTVGVHTLTSGTMPIAGFGVSNYIGAGNYVHIWGAQLEQSSTVGPYVPTTTAAATSNTTESLGLLVEEQRTNSLLRSEEFDTAAWTKVNATVTANAAIAPDGATTADQITFTTTSGQIFQNAGTPSNTTYTFSVWMRAVSGTFNLKISRTDTASWTNATVSPEFTLTTSWQRFSLTFTTGASDTQSGLVIGDENLNAYAMPAAGSIYAWGAQLEAGAFATSYIPTTTAAATRSADVASITGTNFSSWYRQDEGTFYGEATGLSGGGTITVRASADAGERMQFINGTGQTAVISLGAAQVLFGSPGTPKQAFAFKENDFAQKRVGVILETDSSGTVPVVNMATIGKFDFGGQTSLNGTIRRLTYWPQRLPNSTLQALTQP